MAAVVVDGVIHAMGGAGGVTNDNRHTVAVHYVYDPKKNKWEESTPLPFPREHFNLIALDGKIYAIGGRMENFSQNMQTIYSLDLHDANAHWKALPVMPIARSATAAAVLDGKIFVFGGERFGGVFNNTEMFDPVTQRWSELTPMPVGRHGSGAVTVGNMIYLPAGGVVYGGSGQTNANQAFTFP
jgi:N-acetylneuraminic acid mutarotase